MRLPQTRSGAVAFTLIELLCVIAVIAILAGLLLPSLSRGASAAKRIQCVNQLHEMGLAFAAFAHDHNNGFPMSVPRANGGSLEFVENAYRVDGDFYFGFRHFQPLKHHLAITKPLICPVDTRLPAQSYEGLHNENVSYFVGLSATPDRPMSVLAGDRNVVLAGKHETLIRMASGQHLRWDGTMHQFRGNLLFADGHVEQQHNFEFTTPQLPGNAASTDLVLPSVKTSGAIAPSATARKAEPGKKRQDSPSAFDPAPGTGPQTNGPTVQGHSMASGKQSIPIEDARVESPRLLKEAKATNPPPAISEPAGTKEVPKVQHSWFAAFLAEVTEPLVRELGLSLYLLLLLLVVATLALRRWLQRAPSKTFGSMRWPHR